MTSLATTYPVILSLLLVLSVPTVNTIELFEYNIERILVPSYMLFQIHQKAYQPLKD